MCASRSLFRDAVTRCVSTVETQPGMTLVAALLSILLVPIAIVLLCITVIGIAAIPFVLFGLFCMGLFGKAVMLGVARRARDWPRGRLHHPAVAVLVGGLIVLVLYLVPVLGLPCLQDPRSVRIRSGGLHAHSRRAGPAARAVRRRGVCRGHGRGRAGAVPPGRCSSAGPVPGARRLRRAARGLTRPRAGGAPPPHVIDPAVAATLPRAGFWIRMAALLLDVLLVGILMGMLHHSSDLELLVLAVYGALMWKLRGSTVGGIVFHLQVVQSRWPADRLGNGHRARARLLPVYGGRGPRVLLDRLRLGQTGVARQDRGNGGGAGAEGGAAGVRAMYRRLRGFGSCAPGFDRAAGAFGFMLCAACAPALAASGKCKLGKMAEFPVTMSQMSPETVAKINGTDVRFIIDSGAFYSVLDSASAAALGLHVYPAPVGFYGARDRRALRAFAYQRQ